MCRGADDAFAGRHAKLSLHALAMLHVEPMTKNLLLFVVEHDAQNLVVDHALDLLSRAPQKFFDIENRAHFPADFIEQQQGVRLGAHASRTVAHFQWRPQVGWRAASR